MPTYKIGKKKQKRLYATPKKDDGEPTLFIDGIMVAWLDEFGRLALACVDPADQEQLPGVVFDESGYIEVNR